MVDYPLNIDLSFFSVIPPPHKIISLSTTASQEILEPNLILGLAGPFPTHPSSSLDGASPAHFFIRFVHKFQNIWGMPSSKLLICIQSMRYISPFHEFMQTSEFHNFLIFGLIFMKFSVLFVSIFLFLFNSTCKWARFAL